jgi:hypothetical protein
MPARNRAETGANAIHAIARKAPELALLSAVVELTVRDARRGDMEALEWIRGPDCYQFLAMITLNGTDPKEIHTALVRNLEE